MRTPDVVIFVTASSLRGHTSTDISTLPAMSSRAWGQDDQGDLQVPGGQRDRTVAVFRARSWDERGSERERAHSMYFGCMMFDLRKGVCCGNEGVFQSCFTSSSGAYERSHDDLREEINGFSAITA